MDNLKQSTNPWESRKEALRQHALELGFALARFAPVQPPPHAKQLQPWLEQGCHGEMAWLARHPEQRSDPGHWITRAGVILVLGWNMAPALRNAAPDHGVLASYACRADYHKHLMDKLRALLEWLEHSLGQSVEHRLFVDTGPILEKPLAVAAGCGWQGKNALLVNRRFGCWLHLAELFLALPMTPDAMTPDHCGSCDRCLKACPTDALDTPYRLDATRCLAYFTVESRGPIPLRYRSALGGRIFGCDACIVACPWNRFAPVTTLAEQVETRPLAEWARMDGPTFQAIFRATPVARVGLTRFLRNVATALGNWHHPEALPPLAHLLRHSAPLVRAHAVWGVHQQSLHTPQEACARELLRAAAQRETVQEVLTELAYARQSAPDSSWP
ncbi:MAG: tRNA epoxyqueuosine(34) reductase QueG [Magnetococcales bacterium]|nr:tRNA epoxyqueuosine(34) reductase QueG [Magnetococcales bacterium]NGZ06090.1 tRNA epoxyqueuosine(34) reductase QueG [Magnetococcales bacterium]